PDEFFARFLEQTIRDGENQFHRFASVGCGNCDTEIRVAQLLVNRGFSHFTIDCLDINSPMLERGRSAAMEANLEQHIRPQLTDFNTWQPEPATYSAILANQSLHHVAELETLFSTIEFALSPDGRFLTSDMIGRNGHMRWPEAMAIIHEYWRELPQASRWNRQLQRHEELLEYWDCSNEGFEGIRAQDILPLLIERFDFELFLPYGNLIDPFIDRSFGGNFNPKLPEDRDLIDRIHARDTAEILAGTITPTHLIAVMRKRPFEGKCLHPPGLTPTGCVRNPP
ncbi:MAG TPA: class I SAM-dependent methyltransferase, partial [Dokdonella sp.]|uniref:class I SAM-dependent methyltransferase n=1 Tax=Dokdonella sp. TaxID=2291710 RepID=UPI002D7E5D3B